VYQVGN